MNIFAFAISIKGCCNVQLKSCTWKSIAKYNVALDSKIQNNANLCMTPALTFPVSVGVRDILLICKEIKTDTNKCANYSGEALHL